MPPLSFGERFEDAYEVVFLLDDRSDCGCRSRSRSIIESVFSGCKFKLEVRRLPVGDGIWIARHNYIGTEYVLDFIVERKNVDDLRCSLRDNRYRDQKLRLLRCGLKKLIYLVEGDPNSCEAVESIKTACFTTEILEGFDIQRTENLTETLRKYGYITEAIFKYYKELPEEQHKHAGVCITFDEFNKRGQDLNKMTVSDVFAIQLKQVPQVTEEVAIAVLDLYQTPFSLAQEYSLLEGDIHIQEEMLRTDKVMKQNDEVAARDAGNGDEEVAGLAVLAVSNDVIDVVGAKCNRSEGEENIASVTVAAIAASAASVLATSVFASQPSNEEREHVSLIRAGVRRVAGFLTSWK